MSLLLYARETRELSAVFAARDFVSAWLDRSFYAVDPDAHFAWYDHGVADRLVSFVMLWEWAITLRFDQRFTARLLEATFRHCQLLGTEVFYCYNQTGRYHNHGVYQDLALLFAAKALPELSQQQAWLETAESRLADQLENLVVHDCGMTISIENSIGYHRTLLELVEFGERLLATRGEQSGRRGPIEGMRRFSQLVTYVDGRVAAFGDGNREPNPASNAGLPPYAASELQVLANAGYAFAKGNHEQRPFMLSVIASSASATHKHQDNLSFSLFFDGVEWLIDPAYYSYDPTHEVATYLRSAVAHNAVVLPDSAYSIAPGKASLSGTREADQFRIHGRHQSYASVVIEREIAGDLRQLDLRFAERISPEQVDFAQPVVLMLHCGDGVDVRQTGRSLQLTHVASAYALTISLPDDRIVIEQGEVRDGRVRGVAGTNFTQLTPIKTIACELTSGGVTHWSIVAEQALRQ